MPIRSKQSAICVVLAAVVGTLALRRFPYPEEHALLTLLAANRPGIAFTIQWAYTAMLFSTPWVVTSTLLSVAYIFGSRAQKPLGRVNLPEYPPPEDRNDLFVVLGEVHQTKRPEPSETPRWLTIPARGLFTGISIIGAIVSGKTSGCMYPFAKQILGFRADDRVRRIGGLILEVKGDFCARVHEILTGCGREADYVEVSLDSNIRYNPLHNDLDAYALAYGIATLLNNLYGKGKEPFWQQAYTNMITFVILLHKILYDYVTLFDVYQGAIDSDHLEKKIEEAGRMFDAKYISIAAEEFLARHELESHPFEPDAVTKRMRAPFTPEIKAALTALGVAFEIQNEAGQNIESLSDDKRQQFEAVKRWFHQDWKRIDARLRTSIVEGISVFLSLFDDNPAVKRVFCPPKEVFDPIINADGHLGRPLLPFSEMIEQGSVCALNFPVSANPGLAKIIGTLMKQDFQRAVLNRIPKIERERGKHYREVLFLCDEYHSFATVGESDPSGDERFFALSRQAKCIAIVATQSISSLRSTLPGETWRTLLQTFRTKIFLTLSDDFSARCASDLCGKDEQLKASYSMSESGQDGGVSMLTGSATAHKATIGTSKSYNVQRDFVFEAKVFAELKNAQAIVLAYDGLNPHPPTYCYLKPYYLDPNDTYFEQLAKGTI
jgi:TraM recognition site of TraD and TraG